MTNIDVRVVATANVTQQVAAFAKVEAQVASLNKQLAAMVNLQHGVDAKGYERLAKTAAVADKNFRNAVASTGMFEQSQVRINSLTDEYVKKLNNQKLSFRQMFRERQVAAKAYKEQLAMESMMVRKPATATTKGKAVYDAIVPKAVSAEIDSAGRRMAWLTAQVKSGSKELVNWGKNTQWAGRQLTVGFTVPMMAAAGAAGVMAYKIDQQMTRVLKVYNTTASAVDTSIQGQMAYEKELQQVREDSMKTALNAAKTYGSAATDTLDVQAELAAQGVKGAQLQQQTMQIMRASMLGEIDYQTTIKASVTLQNVYHQSTKQLADSFNYMNSVENATSLTTKDFAEAIPIAAAPVKLFGGDLQELGTLLVAMKSRGIEATQGANAIKAAMQRLARPSKTIREEWQQITGTDITKIYQNAHGIIDLFTKISDATKGLSRQDQTKAFSGLFGTYQVSRMIAMTQGMQDLQNGVGQVSQAYQIAQQSTDQWAKVSEQEVKQTTNSLSGQFKRTLSTLQIELAGLGKIFVPLATIVLKGITGIVNIFNKLPKGVKIFTGFGLGLVALAGPVTMLAGLFANLTGNILSMGAGFAKLFFHMDIFDKETRVGKLAAEMQEVGFMKEANAANLLRESIEKLNLSLQQSAELSGLSAKAAAEAAVAETAAAEAAQRRVFVAGSGGTVASTQGALVAAQTARAEKEATASTAAAREKINKYAAGTAVSMGAIAAGMILSSKHSKGFEHDLGNSLTTMGLLVPAVSIIGPMLMNAGKRAVSLGKALGVAAIEGGGIVNALKAAGGGLAALLSPVGIASTLIVGAGIGIWAWHKHIVNARKEQERLNNSINNMTDAWATATGAVKKQWAGVEVGIGNAIKKSKEAALIAQYSTGESKQAVTDYKTLPGGTGAQVMTGGNEISSQVGDKRYQAIEKHFVELQAVYGKSEKDALNHVRALMAVAGEGLDKQNIVVEALKRNIGEITQANIGEYLQKEIDTLNNFQVNTDGWKNQAAKVGQAFVDGFNKNASPKQAKQLMDKFGSAAKSEWSTQFSELNKDPAIANAFKALGIGSAKEFRAAATGPGGLDALQKKLEGVAQSSGLISTELLSVVGAANQSKDAEAAFIQAVVTGQSTLGLSLDDNIKTFDDFSKEWIVKGQAMNLNQAQAALKGLKDQMLGTDGATVDFINHAKGGFSDTTNTVAGLRKAISNLSDGDRKKFDLVVNLIAARENIKKGKDDAETYNNILKGIKNTTDGVASSTGAWASKVTDAVKNLSGTGKDIMTGVQQDMADRIQQVQDDRLQAQTDARQKYWDAQQKAQSDRFDKQSVAQSRRFDNESNALDKKWSDRTDAANKYWDNRIKRVNDEIDAEQKADDKRQKIFQAEIDRINKLRDTQNANIDFNAALNSGNFDEAAKIRNDQTAGEAQNLLEAAMTQDEAKSKARQDRLKNQVDALGTRKDKYLKGLQRREDAEKRHLKRMQENEAASLKKRQDAEAASLKARTDASMKALAKEQEAERQSLKDRLALFMDYIAKNKKDLEKHMKDVGLSYKDFGDNTLKPTGEGWAKFFGERLQYHIREAGKKIRSDTMWAHMGKTAALQLVKGMGFKNWHQFIHFTETGDMTGGGKKGSRTAADLPAGGGNGPLAPHTQLHGVIPGIRHGGGWVEGGKDSRTGVAGSLRGLHASEKLILAKKKEFVVNESAASRHGALLEAINSGEIDKSRGNVGNGIGGGVSLPQALMAGLLGAVTQGFAKNVTNLFTNKMMASAGGSYAAGNAGKFAGYTLDSEQLGNAATIASVGSKMGMSARDIEIAIMTAMTESGLRNLHGGDRDSQGLFQQRPSMGWGTVAQVTTPTYAATQFYDHLKNLTDRNTIAPWLAAQGVQRSAFSDGSNYETYWRLAQAIFNKGLVSTGGGNMGIGKGFRVGSGGWAMPSIPGKGWVNSHDYRNGLNSPLYAYNDGTVIESRAITSGGSPGNGLYSTPYRSYGETIVIRGDDGNTVRQAHLSPGKRFVRAGERVTGGSLIGLSGQTGHATGPHTHYEVNGQEIAREWFAANGIGLRIGGTVQRDGTAAILHKDERVLTAPLTKKLDAGIETIYKMTRNAHWRNSLAGINAGMPNIGNVARNVANGYNTEYNINVNVEGTNASPDDIANAVMAKIKRHEARLPGSRRG